MGIIRLNMEVDCDDLVKGCFTSCALTLLLFRSVV